MAAKGCKTCGAPVPANTGKGRPRVHCLECRPRNRTAVQVRTVAALGSPADVSESGVYAATLRELTAADRIDTAKGQACLLLAERLAEKVDTAAGMAAAVKQLREALDDAMAGASVVADPVDELQRRRAAKFA